MLLTEWSIRWRVLLIVFLNSPRPMLNWKQWKMKHFWMFLHIQIFVSTSQTLTSRLVGSGCVKLNNLNSCHHARVLSGRATSLVRNPSQRLRFVLTSWSLSWEKALAVRQLMETLSKLSLCCLFPRPNHARNIYFTYSKPFCLKGNGLNLSLRLLESDYPKLFRIR